MIKTIKLKYVDVDVFYTAINTINEVGGEYKETVHLNDGTVVVYEVKD